MIVSNWTRAPSRSTISESVEALESRRLEWNTLKYVGHIERPRGSLILSSFLLSDVSDRRHDHSHMFERWLFQTYERTKDAFTCRAAFQLSAFALCRSRPWTDGLLKGSPFSGPLVSNSLRKQAPLLSTFNPIVLAESLTNIETHHSCLSLSTSWRIALSADLPFSSFASSSPFVKQTEWSVSTTYHPRYHRLCAPRCIKYCHQFPPVPHRLRQVPSIWVLSQLSSTPRHCVRHTFRILSKCSMWNGCLYPRRRGSAVTRSRWWTPPMWIFAHISRKRARISTRHFEVGRVYLCIVSRWAHSLGWLNGSWYTRYPCIVQLLILNPGDHYTIFTFHSFCSENIFNLIFF